MSLDTLRALAAEIAESEHLLREAELDKDELIHLMQQMLDHSSKVIFWKDTEGRIIGCNSQCEKMLNTDRSNIIGHIASDLFSGDQLAMFTNADMIAKSSGEYEYDMSFKAPTGKIVAAHVNVWRSANLAGDTTGVIIFAYSITPSETL